MAKDKDRAKLAFYKQRRKKNTKITDVELLRMWTEKKALEKGEKPKVEVKAAVVKVEPVPPAEVLKSGNVPSDTVTAAIVP